MDKRAYLKGYDVTPVSVVLNEEEFNNAMSKLPGVRRVGDNWVGIRLLTPPEHKERAENAEKIRDAICEACASDERTCGSGCLLAAKRVHMTIAAMLPIGVKLIDLGHKQK